MEGAELKGEGADRVRDVRDEEPLFAPDPPEELSESEGIVTDPTTCVRGTLGGDVPLVTVEPHVEEASVLLLEDDGLRDVGSLYLIAALTPVQESIEGTTDMRPVVILIEDVSSGRSDDGIQLRGIDLVVDEEDQVREPRMTLALDSEGLLKVLQGLFVTRAQEALKWGLVEEARVHAAHWFFSL